MPADNASYFTLALVLTALSGVLTYLAWRRWGLSALLRGTGITMLPLALWLTQTLRLASNIVDDVGNWATALVFSPRVWVGLIVLAVAVVVFGAGTALARRGKPTAGTTPRSPVAPASGKASSKAVRRAQPASGVDDDLADIEAMLRERGIS